MLRFFFILPLLMLNCFLQAEAPKDAGKQNTEGFYVGGMGGANFLVKPRMVVKAGTGEDYQAHYNFGGCMGAFVGYRFDDEWRVETELSYRKTNLSEVKNLSSNARTSADGDLASWTGLATLYYDLGHFPGVKKILPYVGYGMGISSVRFSNNTAGFTPVKSSKDMFAFQLVAGFSYNLGSQYTLFSDYRYMGTNKIQFTDTLGNDVDHHNINHVASLGLRYHF